MAYVANMNLNDTAIASAPTSITAPMINWGADYIKSQNVPGSVVLAYNKAPIDAPQTVRFASTPIANIYQNTPVDPSYQLPQKRGLSLVAQLNQVVTVTDNADPSFRVDLPYSAHVVLRTPMSSFLTEAQIWSILTRAMSCLVDKQTVANPYEYRLKQLLRGGLVPDRL